MHAAAVKNPKMLGGPFMDVGHNRVDDIRALRDQIQRQRQPQIQLSNAITQLDAVLRTEAKGFSLHPLYQKIPPALRGYVELVYDLNDSPSFRLIEPLLYKSQYYASDAQSLLFSEITQDDRPFVLSTPRLDFRGAVHLRMPFDHPAVDEIFHTKTTPRPLNEIGEAIRSYIDSDGISVDQLFTPIAPQAYLPYTGSGIRWRYFGHACILIETPAVSILFDPVLSYTYKHGISRYTYEDLPSKINYVLITHNHQDHVLFETLIQLRHKIECVIVPRCSNGSLQDPSLKLLLKHVGFKQVIELDELETIDCERVSVTGLPFLGEHADLDIRTKLGYLIDTRGHKLMFVADSCNIEPVLYQHLGREVGPVDALFIGMECDGAPLSWLYGPLLTKARARAADQSRRLSGSNFEQAFDIVDRFKCKEVYIYAMGQEPWLNYIMSLKYTEQSRPIVESNKLIEACKGRNIVAERLFGEKEILMEAKGRATS